MENHSNTVELLGYYGSDEVIAQSAWTSTSRDLTPEKRKRIPQLIQMLWSNGHETPFEKGVVHFLCTTDIATHIHLIKHRISSINAESARYKELKDDKYYLPNDWKDIPLSDKTSKVLSMLGVTNLAYNENDDTNWYALLDGFNHLANTLYHQAIEDLEEVLGRKRTKETARYFKPYSSQITADVMFNMRSFANFLKLRANNHAQGEINEIAHAMAKAVLVIEGNPFEHTMRMFGFGIKGELMP